MKRIYTIWRVFAVVQQRAVTHTMYVIVILDLHIDEKSNYNIEKLYYNMSN